jgi:hypothetical protein
MFSTPRAVQSSRWDGAIFLIIPNFVPGFYRAVPPGQKTKMVGLDPKALTESYQLF